MAYRLPNGVKTITPGQEFRLGDDGNPIKIQPGQVADAIEARCTAIVNATGAHAALTTAQRDALLNQITVDFAFGGEGEADQDQVYQARTFKQLLGDAEALARYIVAGYTDAVTGLATALNNGANTLKWVTLIPIGRVEQLVPKRAVGGMGRGQLLTARLLIKLGTDPLAPLDALLALVSVNIELWPWTRPVNGEQWGRPPVVRYKPNSGALQAGFPDGLPVRVTEETNAVSAAPGTLEIQTKIGDEIVHDFPASAADILNELLRDPTVTGADDTSERHTLCFAFGDSPLKALRTGPVTVSQRTAAIASLNLTYTGYTVQPYEGVKRDVMRIANQNPAGTVIKAISSATLDGLEVESRHLPFVPWRAFADGERQFALYPGLRCEQGKEPEVHIPEHIKDAAAYQYAQALAAGDQSRATDVIRNVATPIPGAVVSGRGFKGARSWVVTEVQKQIEDRVKKLAQQA